MNERALTVFEQYELDITETFKIRGNYGCNTPDGKYILQEYDNSNDKMVSMKSLYNHFILCAKTAKDLWRRLKVFIPAKICL